MRNVIACALLTLATAGPTAGQSVDPAFAGLSPRLRTPSGMNFVPRPEGTDVSALVMAASPFGRAYGGSGNDEAYLVRRNVDGSFVLGGHTNSFGAGGSDLWLLRMDGSGTITWQKTYGTPGEDNGDVFATADGGYAICGFSTGAADQTTAWIAKLDAAGAIVWQKQIAPADAGFSAAQLLSDGGFLLSGNAFDMNTFTFTFKMARLNSSGAIVWQKEYPSSRMLTGVPQQLSDGSFIVSGTDIDFESGSTGIWVMKLASTGAIQWQKSYGGASDDIGGLIVPVSGGYFLSGQTNSFGPGAGSDEFNILLLKLDASGNIVWQRVYGGPGTEFGLPFALSDGMVLSGVTDSFGAGLQDAFIARLDSGGAVQWAKTYGGVAEDELITLADPAGGYIAWGLTRSFGGGNDDVWVLKFDSSFNITWQRAYGGGDDDWAGPLRQTDGTILATGGTRSFGSGGDDLWVMSLDANGQIPSGCQPIRNTAVSGASFTFTTALTTATASDPGATTVDTSLSVTNYSLTVGTSSAASTNACTASSSLRATASASTTSGAAPLAVTFTGAASGGQGPYSFEWSFGDGSAIDTHHNISHTYTAPGTYRVTLTVIDALAAVATDTHLAITVTSGGGSCSVTVEVNVPSAGTVGTPVAFSADATATGCALGPVYAWTFGDGNAAGGQDVAHTYAAPGAYSWNLVVQAGVATATASGTITITGGAGGTVAFIPSVAHAPGAGGTQWRSDVAAVNRSSAAASLTLLFTSYDGGQSITRNANLESGATVEWRDILVSLFGVSASASTKGTLKVTSNVPVRLTSRTYNQTSAGTFGQYYPAVSEADALLAGQTGIVPHMKKNASFRTNLGILNPGSAQIAAAVKLYSAAGVQVGGTKTMTVPAGRWIQQDDIFGNVGAANQDIAYATVEVQTAGGRAWTYASVIDAATGDPTTIPVLAP